MEREGIKFIDSRKWGTRTFLDFLEVNDVPFRYDGKLLSFPDTASQQRATEMWYSLTGMRQIGVVA
jgi:hypothetical protein